MHVCIIELFTDIPVDDSPSALFTWAGGSPGHSFLKITKSSEGKSISQNVGFYPEMSFKSMATTAPIPAKFVDNAYHEYNATIKMSITTSQLDKVLNAIQVTAKTVKYDVDDYNCTNFAIDIFNMVRSTDPIVQQGSIYPARSIQMVH